MSPAAPNESLPGEPSNIERRQNADIDTENRNNPGDRRANNLKAYHEGQIAELQKEIDKHQAIVDQQDAILNGDLDANTPLPVGTDIAARFRQAEGGDDERPPSRPSDLRRQREEARWGRDDDERDDDERDRGNMSATPETPETPETPDASNATPSTEPTSTPAEPVSDDAPKRDEAKLNDPDGGVNTNPPTPDATPENASKPTPKTPSNRNK